MKSLQLLINSSILTIKRNGRCDQQITKDNLIQEIKYMQNSKEFDTENLMKIVKLYELDQVCVRDIWKLENSCKGSNIKYWWIINQTKVSNLINKYSIKIEGKLSNEIIKSEKEYWYKKWYLYY